MRTRAPREDRGQENNSMVKQGLGGKLSQVIEQLEAATGAIFLYISQRGRLVELLEGSIADVL